MKGYDIFGKAYGVMLRNDLHDPRSVDHRLLAGMELLDERHYEALPVVNPAIVNHGLYGFAQQFRGENDMDSIRRVLDYTSGIALSYDVPLEDMLFGGTEEEILARGTDWCADMARVGLTLLNCLGIPARMLNLVNCSRAYNGHVVVEAFPVGQACVADCIFGYLFPHSALELGRRPELLKGAEPSHAALFDGMAVSDYDPMAPENDYTVSRTNEYTRRIIEESGDRGVWIMGEEDEV